MIKFFASVSAGLFFTVSAAFAATFEYPIQIDAISGDGEALNVGFFSTGSVGDLGIGRARTDFDFPTGSAAALDGDSLFQAVFSGVASAASLFANPVVHDASAGTVTVSGSLGGVTGPYSEFLSAGMFEFVFQGAAGAAFASVGDYEAFLSSATMSGYFEGIFTVDGGRDGSETFLRQRIDFSDTTAVPLPAGSVLLLSGLGLILLRRKRHVS